MGAMAAGRATAVGFGPAKGVRLRRFLPWAGLALLLLAAGAAADDPPGELEDMEFAAKVNAAIDRGVAWLKESQQKDGSWGPCVATGTYDGKALVDPRCYFIGPTAFSVFTLSRCGVPRKDKVIKHALKWMDDRAGTAYDYTSYESSAVILMLTALYDDGGDPLAPSKSPSSPAKGSKFKRDDWKWMHERILHLVGDEKGGCQTKAGGWTYKPGLERPDVSATQFALLALREARRAGYPIADVSGSTWKRAGEYLQAMQLENGGFPYEHKPQGWTLGMTAAGLASLLIVDEQMKLAGSERPPWIAEAEKRAFDFLGEKYTPVTNPQQNMGEPPLYHYCYLYAVERVGGISRRQLLGRQLWYPYGAEYLLSTQKEDGHWDDPSCMKPQDVLGTCFALLFLKRTTMPSAVVTGSD